MNPKFIFALLLSFGLALSGHSQSVLFLEDFESPGGDYGYTLDPPNDCGCCDNNDQWGRTTGIAAFTCSGIGGSAYPPGNISGTYFFGAEDVDDPDIQTPPGSLAPASILTLDTVRVDGQFNLQFEALLATPISSTTAPSGYVPTGQFEGDDEVLFQYALNGDVLLGNYTTFAALRANVDGDLAVDEDGDGTIDGPALDSALSLLSFDIPVTGKILSVRIVFDVDDAQEEVALDRIQVLGCTLPKPPTSVSGDTAICFGESTTLTLVGGDLGDFSDWAWYEGSCGGPTVGMGTSITVGPASTTTYFIGPVGGCTSIGACRAVTVNVSQINGSFTTSTPTSGCVPLLVSFDDTSPGAVAWTWTFPDGDAGAGVATSNSPSFLYTNTGDFDVQLVVENSTGCRDTVLASNYIAAQGSEADFTVDVNSGCNPLDVNFTDASSSYGGVSAWSWDFGDGTTSTLPNPMHTYSDGDVFDVSLSVTDSNGCVSAAFESEFIVADTVKPVVSFPAGDQTGAADASCQATLPDYTGSAVVTDACMAGMLVTQNPAAGLVLSGAGSSQTVWIKAEDAGGNADSVSFTFTVEDVSAPSLTAISDQDLVADATCQASLPDYTGLTSVSDNCDVSPTVVQSPAPGTVISGAGTSVLVTISATDASTNSADISFTVNLLDQSNPTVGFPSGDQVGAADASCQSILPDFRSGASVSDNCDATPTLTQVPASGTVLSGAGTVQTVWIKAEDASGNADSVSFTYTVEDVTAPSLTAISDQDIVADTTCQATLPDYTSLTTISDNCDATPMIVQSPAAGTPMSGAGTSVVVTISATDSSGNNADIAFTATVRDQSNPSVSFPAGDQVGAADASCQSSLPDFRGGATVNDNCDATPVVTQTPAPGTVLSGAGTVQTVWIRAEDASGNADSVSFTYTVEDVTAPSLTAVSDQDVAADASCQATLPDFTGLTTVSDNCDLAPTLVQSPAPGTVLSGAGSSVLVTLTATDASSNSADVSFTATVRDQSNPTVSFPPGDQVGAADASCQSTLPDFRGSASVTDNCDTLPTITQDPAPGTVLSGAGTAQTVWITAEDASGNADSVSFTFTVEDVTAPSLTPVSDQELVADASCEATLPDYTGLTTVTDNCDASPTIVQSPAAGTTISGGGTSVLVTMTATDSSGNNADIAFTVTLRDQSNPTVSFPAGDQVGAADANCQSTLPDFRGGAAVNDNCDALPVVTQTPAPGTVLSGDGTVQTVWIMAEDASGNADSVSFTYTVLDLTAPALTAISDQTVWLDGACQATMPDYRGLTTVTDNCDASPVITQSPAPGSLLSGTGSQVLTITAEDASGNTASETFNVDRKDPLPPTMTIPADQSETVDAACEFSMPDYRPLAMASDNCDASPVVTQSPAPGTIIDGTTGPITVSITVTDASGYFTSGTFEVEAIDNQAPPSFAPPVPTLS